MTRILFAACLTVLSIGFSSSSVVAESKPQTVKFNRDIRPILSQHCFRCHGPDENKRQAEMRLDVEESVKAVFGNRKVEMNEAWKRINSTDDDYRMPPPTAHTELKPAEIRLIKSWIEQGTQWRGHWAFEPIRKPALPSTKNKSWAINPIDIFIMSRLEREGLEPSPAAERARLLRRVTFDLTGLPPTLDEIDQFLNDNSPKAYEKVVDRLLASKQFGERMTVAWMDAARYGDSSVHHADGPRDMWAWRDWVINAYNDNKPFDRFTIEQLAGDFLPNATIQQKIATGFNRNNATTDEGGAIAEEYRVEYAVDRVKTTSMVWLGLTLECAQCHDHKYDPFKQREYYQFFAYFNQASDPGMQTRRGNQSPIVNVPNLEAAAQIETIKKEIAEFESKLKLRESNLDADFQTWLTSISNTNRKHSAVPTDMLVHFALDEKKGKQVTDAVDAKRKGKVNGRPKWSQGKFAGAFECDGRNFIDLGAIGNFERTDSFSYGAWIKPKGAGSGAPIARMDDRSGFRGYDLHIGGGRVAVHIINSWPSNAIKVTTKKKIRPNQWQHVFVTYDGSSKASGVKIYFDGKPQEWAIEQDRLSGTIQTKKTLYLGRRNPGSPYQGAIDDVRMYARHLSDSEVEALAGNDTIAPILALKPNKRTPAQVDILKRHFLTNHDKPYQAIRKNLTSLQTQLSAASKPISTVMVMQDLAKPRMTYILERGHYASPLKDRAVQPGTPAALPPLPKGAAANRLGMAEWLMQTNHPLTSRVAVNRYWYTLFGTGIVKTLENFGSQGEPPRHPELLDWLANDFIVHGWDIKRTLKQMVVSATYRQSSRITRALWERDPENRLLARGPRFRLQGEFIRDGALAASGLLNRKIGGPSVKPYQPPGLWNEVSLSGNVRFVQDKGDKLYRRSMYTYWKRSSPSPILTVFDAPSREKCSLRRSRTNTPSQALIVLNGPQYLEAARVLAERCLKQGGDTLDQRIVHAYRLVAGVRPKSATLAILRDAYHAELVEFKKDTKRAKQLVSIGEFPRDEKLDVAEHAAFSIVTSMILNLDETLTRG